MKCPENKKVPLIVFLFEGEDKRWWIGKRREKFHDSPISRNDLTIPQLRQDMNRKRAYKEVIRGESSEKKSRFANFMRGLIVPIGNVSKYP
ncbi:hypothetical protein IEQ34_007757 [Dendrobium chrysotoxum]|uniref:Uncharacterized protein n=1 Tax=Dendrobium chrysotoxum TaxID=161865 RepID=A0AAV7H6L3_DENCH|nr:hypothetical protein IEQ34_007757 [Dendrobium chrysotoxum]